MKVWEIKLVGFTPVIWNRMKKEIEDAKKKLRKNELAEFEEKNWLLKAEYNGNGDVVVPSEWLKGMLINACKQTGFVPHYATKKTERYTRYVQGVFISESPVVCKKNDLECYGAFLPSQPGKLNSGKIWKVFPMLKNWSVVFRIHDPFGRMRKDELEALLDYGGKFVGIGDLRIMNYGRFEVEYVKEVVS